MNYIEVNELHKLIKENPNLIIIDVRTEEEYHDIRIPQTRLTPLNSFLEDPLATIQLIEDLTCNQETIYIICLSDGRSLRATQTLEAYHIKNVCFVRGGTKAWINSGYPTLSGS